MRGKYWSAAVGRAEVTVLVERFGFGFGQVRVRIPVQVRVPLPGLTGRRPVGVVIEGRHTVNRDRFMSRVRVQVVLHCVLYCRGPPSIPLSAVQAVGRLVGHLIVLCASSSSCGAVK